MPQSDQKEPAGPGVWKIVVILAICFGAAIAAIWLLLARFSNEELAARALGHISWPLVVFVVGLPAMLFVAPYIRQLVTLMIDFKQAIDKAPERLQASIEKAEQLRSSIEQTGGQVINKMSQALGELEARMTDFEGRWNRITGQAPEVVAPEAVQLSPRERLADHIEAAGGAFYEALEKWNESHPGAQLVVNRGGGNRPELVDRLRDANAFSRDPNCNRALGDYLREAFRIQLASRRGGVTAADADRLDGLKRVAEQAGAQFDVN